MLERRLRKVIVIFDDGAHRRTSGVAVVMEIAGRGVGWWERLELRASMRGVYFVSDV